MTQQRLFSRISESLCGRFSAAFDTPRHPVYVYGFHQMQIFASDGDEAAGDYGRVHPHDINVIIIAVIVRPSSQPSVEYARRLFQRPTLQFFYSNPIVLSLVKMITEYCISDEGRVKNPRKLLLPISAVPRDSSNAYK